MNNLYKYNFAVFKLEFKDNLTFVKESVLEKAVNP